MKKKYYQLKIELFNTIISSTNQYINEDKIKIPLIYDFKNISDKINITDDFNPQIENNLFFYINEIFNHFNLYLKDEENIEFIKDQFFEKMKEDNNYYKIIRKLIILIIEQISKKNQIIQLKKQNIHKEKIEFYDILFKEIKELNIFRKIKKDNINTKNKYKKNKDKEKYSTEIKWTFIDKDIKPLNVIESLYSILEILKKLNNKNNISSIYFSINETSKN